MKDLYTLTVPMFIKQLSALSGVLSKGESYAKEKNIPEETLLKDQLIADMFPLVKQVQVACDNAKLGVARLAGIEAPSHADTEMTFAELRTRIASTLDFLKGVSADHFAGANTRKIEIKYFPGHHMTGEGYAMEYLVPNVYFHVSMAYAILRKSGVPIGKADFTGGLPLIAN